MADSDEPQPFHLTQAELDAEARFEAVAEPAGRRRGLTRHHGRFWLGVLVVVGMVIVGLIVLFPRRSPCHEQIIYEPTGGGPRVTVERCAPPGQSGGVFYDTP